MQSKHILTLMAVVFLAACDSRKEELGIKDAEVIPVKLMTLERSESPRPVAASGRFTTDDESILSFKTGGIIHKILVQEGDAIKAGQLLATIHLNEIDAQVSQARAAYDKALRDHQRVSNLYADSVASLEQMQNSKTALEVSRQQLNAAQFNRTYAEIRAVRNGFVLRKLANEGQVVGPGTPVLQTNSPSRSGWLLRVGVSDKDWAAIHINDKAEIRTEASSGEMLEGYVFRRAEGVDPATGSFTIDIKLSGQQPEVIAAGMFGHAVISASGGRGQQKEQGRWAIPYDALLDGDGSTGYVFITDDRRTARKVKVTIAAMDKDRIWISEGLENARELIISGSPYLTDGSRINVAE